jgi:GntR family transcriptional regulator
LTGRIHLDFRADDPIVMQIVRQIEDLVNEGVFKPGDQLPTVRELAIDLRINFSTVARAYRILDEKRLISTQRGRGTYIEEPAERTGDQPAGDATGRPNDGELEKLARRFVREASQSGASPKQIERALRRQLEEWRHNAPAPSGHHQGG